MSTAGYIVFALIAVLAFLAFGLPDVIIIDKPATEKKDYLIGVAIHKDGKDRR